MGDDNEFVDEEGVRSAYVPVDGQGPVEYGFQYGVRHLLTDLVEQDLWDRPPLLAIVVQAEESMPREELLAHALEHAPQEVRDRIEDGTARLGGLEMGFHPLDIPDTIWALAPVPDTIEAMAMAIREGISGIEAPPEGVRIAGLLLATEAWALRADKLPEGEREEAQRLAQEGDLAEHPNRVEIRMVYGVDRAGYRYSACQARGDDEIDEVVNGPGITGQLRMAGRVPEVLEQFLAAIVGEPAL